MNDKQIGLLAAFFARRVEFAVVGGVAVNLYGYGPPMIWTFSYGRQRKTRAALEALGAVGAAVEGLSPGDLLDDEANFRFGEAENHVDILASIGEMPFDQVWRNRFETTVQGLTAPVPFISKADLIANKQQVGRLRDLADVEELKLIGDVDEA